MPPNSGMYYKLFLGQSREKRILVMDMTLRDSIHWLACCRCLLYVLRPFNNKFPLSPHFSLLLINGPLLCFFELGSFRSHMWATACIIYPSVTDYFTSLIIHIYSCWHRWHFSRAELIQWYVYMNEFLPFTCCTQFDLLIWLVNHIALRTKLQGSNFLMIFI